MQINRAFPAVAILLVVTTFRGASAQDNVRPGELSVRLKSIAAWNPVLDLSSPVLELTPTDVIPLDDGTGRLLIATLGGTIRVHHPKNGLLDQPLFGSHQSGLQLQLESGTTGIAVHPNFANDPNEFGYGKLYTITTENSDGNGGVASERVDFPFASEVHQDVVREWDLSSIVGDDTRNALPALTVGDSREILRVAQPGPFHNIIDLTFDRSVHAGEPGFGQLYIAHGDGGDSKTNASTTQSRKLASQDRSSIYGNLLRINPDPLAYELVRVSENTGDPAYSISPNNPFANDDTVESRNSETLAEIFAYGLRSPYRVNIDSLEGTILFGDVGESRREEISIAELGGNLGWGKFEGTRLDNNFVALQGNEHTPPVFEYGREVGRSIVGGTVYRGSDFPELFGKYVFADFGQAHPSAKLFYGSIDPADEDYGEIFEFDLSRSVETFPVSLDEDATVDAQLSLPDRIFSIGEDEHGELLIIGGQDPRGPVDSVEGAFLIRLTRGLGCDMTGDGRCNVADLD
ncbi:MAG: PQQ-dependent sugar dehydrogenase, partial [Planctomycetota bacterium]